jgi:cellulose synthase/poly-beta-1,6-N-acetylglucosamine synthase-like glycosyltransferase
VTLAGWAVSATLALGLYSYVLYPVALRLLARRGGQDPAQERTDQDWPFVSISLPVYNEGHQIEQTLESLLALDYPKDRIQIMVVSDASSDRTDEIVRSYADRGVEMIRQPQRQGKTAAENRAGPLLRGEIVVNTDASVRIQPSSLKPLIRPFQDPAVGLTSGRDVSVAGDVRTNPGEAGYVGYEMWVRDLETVVGGIIGASGSCYAIRKQLHLLPMPDSLSRDFAAALLAREHGYRGVSVAEAVCVVPRATSLNREYRRKVRTMLRGMETLYHKRSLLNPLRYGRFSWMLFSHKVCRWLLPWASLVALVGLATLAGEHEWAMALLIPGLAVTAVGAIGWGMAGDRSLPSPIAIPAFVLMGNVAALVAGVLALRGDRTPIWEPTRRVGGEGSS